MVRMKNSINAEEVYPNRVLSYILVLKKLSIKLGIYLSDIIAAANETPETELKFGS